MAAIGDRLLQDQQARAADRDSRRRIPRSRRRRADRDAVGRRPGDGIEKGPRTVPADPGAQRKSVSAITQIAPAAAETAPEHQWRRPSYWPFVLPALIVVLAIIIFPWVFTIWMSLHEWKVGSPTTFVGLANYMRLPADPRFVEAIGPTMLYPALSVLLPLL